jgi:SAM-dependent methyltransferase
LTQDTTTRFSSRQRDYARHRPGYPPDFVRALAAALDLSDRSRVADIGSGTGISSRVLLDLGCTVYAVEPNADMRGTAESLFDGHPRFVSVAGTAEATGLPDAGVDAITAGQAFHWFVLEDARREWLRILRPGGAVAIFWNSRRLDATPFLRAYENVLLEYGVDYAEVKNEWVIAERLQTLLLDGGTPQVFVHETLLDVEALKGLARSSSYSPPVGHPRHAPMMEALDRIFQAHHSDGRVRMIYDTRLFTGRIRG